MQEREGLFEKWRSEETKTNLQHTSLEMRAWGIYRLRNTATGHSEAWVGMAGYGGR